ncbi:MAG: hypothetical protein PHD55_11800 [Methanoregula sp.]|nr:hypothetical protein [Methanoregula sp.]
MSPPASLLPSFLLSLLLISILAAPAAALSIQFQDSGLGTQDIDVFGPDGEYIETVNTSSVLKINGTDGPYTFKLRPAPANQDPGTLLQDLLNVLANNILIIALILVGIFLLARRR